MILIPKVQFKMIRAVEKHTTKNLPRLPFGEQQSWASGDHRLAETRIASRIPTLIKIFTNEAS
jgi:hypothetical protein